MTLSYKWLQSYFKKELPSPQEVSDVLNTHAFEIESVDKVANGDTVIDVDVLPNRSHDCLSHRGIAREIGVLFSLKTEEPVFDIDFAKDNLGLELKVEDENFCTRFVGVRINGVKVMSSPEWLKERLESVGQKSINNIVDITNFVMFDIGKPMHAFDADKVKGSLFVRQAKDGERLTTLDGKDVDLDSSVYVIADLEGPLAIAGVKGGNRAEVTEDTQNIIIESAIFDSSVIRKTSRKVSIKTDSSRRFENGISNSLAMDGFMETVALIKENAEGEGFVIGSLIDFYPNKDKVEKVVFRMDKLNSVLGVDISSQEIDSILDRFGFVYEKNDREYSVEIPPERLDLRIEEDMIEEIGRVYGYENIASLPIPSMDFEPKSEHEYKIIENIKNILAGESFSEIQTYMFGDKGEVEVLYPAASDKSKVRSDLKTSLGEALTTNARYADLLGITEVKVFEIGKVVKKDGEYLMLGLGLKNVKKDKKNEQEKLREVLKIVGDKIGVDIDSDIKDGIFEVDLAKIIEKAKDIKEEDLQEIVSHADDTVLYKPVSQYPFVLRDIAVWTPDGTREQEVFSIIEDKGSNLLVRSALFDEYKKEGKTSFAFNLVFQSMDKTLTDDDVNKIMESITGEFVSKGWEVR